MSLLTLDHVLDPVFPTLDKLNDPEDQSKDHQDGRRPGHADESGAPIGVYADVVAVLVDCVAHFVDDACGHGGCDHQSEEGKLGVRA